MVTVRLQCELGWASTAGSGGQHPEIIAMVLSLVFGLAREMGNCFLPRNGFAAHVKVGRAHTLVYFTIAFPRRLSLVCCHPV